MTDLEKAARLALDALKLQGEQYPHMVNGYCLDAITELESALKQLAEPVAAPVVEPSVEAWRRADKFCDANCTALDHHADCVIGNPSW